MTALASRSAKQNEVDATINYFGPVDGIARIYGHDPASNYVNLQPHIMPVHNMSGSCEQPTLDREGFTLLHDIFTPASVEEVEASGPELVQKLAGIVRNVTDCTMTVGVGAAVRRGGRSLGEVGSAPVHYTHVDVTPDAILDLARELAPDAPPFRSVSMYNLWRPLTEMPLSDPLAMCDVRSVKPDDLERIHAHYRDGACRAAFMPRFNPEHRWCYFKDMSTEDGILFKSAESDAGKTPPVAHTAFADMSVPLRRPRSSLELRVLALWF